MLRVCRIRRLTKDLLVQFESLLGRLERRLVRKLVLSREDRASQPDPIREGGVLPLLRSHIRQ